MNTKADIAVVRDDDGDPTLDLYIDTENQIGLILHSSGKISWAGIVDGKSCHGSVTTAALLGDYLYKLCDKACKLDSDAIP